MQFEYTELLRGSCVVDFLDLSLPTLRDLFQNWFLFDINMFFSRKSLNMQIIMYKLKLLSPSRFHKSHYDYSWISEYDDAA
jgi:hypothetical protein